MSLKRSKFLSARSRAFSVILICIAVLSLSEMDTGAASHSVTEQNGRLVYARVNNSGKGVEVSVGDAHAATTFDEGDEVLDVRVQGWLTNDVVVAIKTRNAGGQYGFYWTLGLFSEGEDGEMVITLTGATQFLSSERDCVLSGVFNYESDNICITLLQLPIDGDCKRYLYIHACPMFPLKGRLFSTINDSSETIDSVKAVELPGDLSRKETNQRQDP